MRANAIKIVDDQKPLDDAGSLGVDLDPAEQPVFTPGDGAESVFEAIGAVRNLLGCRGTPAWPLIKTGHG